MPVPSGRCANYARVTNSLLGSLSHTAVWARLPLLSPALAEAEGTDAEETLIAEVRRVVVCAVRDDSLSIAHTHSLCLCRRSKTRVRGHAPTTPGSGGTASAPHVTAIALLDACWTLGHPFRLTRSAADGLASH